MKNLTISWFSLFFLLFSFSSAQVPSSLPCAQGIPLDSKGARTISHDLLLEKMESEMEKGSKSKNQKVQATDCLGKGNKVYRIPTVFHLVHSTSSGLGTGANLQEATVLTLLEEINDAFSHKSGLTYTNPYSGVDTKIQLVLAKRDPTGNATDGIIRYADDDLTINNINNGNTQTQLHWPTTDYLNIYIPEVITTNAGYPNQSYIAGYGFLPYAHGNAKDGIVAHSGWLTSYILIHELGHYFGLYHTFGTCYNNDCRYSGDRVCDTPPRYNHIMGTATCNNPSNSCNSDENDTSLNNPFRSKSQGGLGDMLDGFENYMDYTGGCGTSFTMGQSERMIGFLETIRTSLTENKNAIPLNSPDGGIARVLSPNPNNSGTNIHPVIKISNFGKVTITSLTIEVQLNGVVLSSSNWTGNMAPGKEKTVQLPNFTPPQGVNNLVITTSNPNGTEDYYPKNDRSCVTFTTLANKKRTSGYETEITSEVQTDFCNIYPNPFKEKITIGLSPSEYLPTECMVFSIDGKVVYNKTMRGDKSYSKMIIPTSDWASGIYSVRVSQGGKIKTSRIFKN